MSGEFAVAKLCLLGRPVGKLLALKLATAVIDFAKETVATGKL
jgi:hypothetical protein